MNVMTGIHVQKGLIVDDPWISYILSGQKDWEMRSTATSHRGWFGLIWKGMGAVYGAAKIIDVGTPLTPDQMIEAFDRHRIPEAMIRSGAVSKWNTPWFLADVVRLPKPVRYAHPSGAVTWVTFDDSVRQAIQKQLQAYQDGPPVLETVDASATPIEFHAQHSARLIGESELTQGNIDNNHIYLRPFFDRFPADVVGGSNKSDRAKRDVTVLWEGGDPVVTDLDGAKKLFRARGWTGAFFKLNRATAGDRVVVEEIAPYTYRVRTDKKHRDSSTVGENT